MSSPYSAKLDLVLKALSISRGRLAADLGVDKSVVAESASGNPVPPEGSVPEAIRRHLARDIGPAQLAMGGDWLLRMPVSRSIARGAPFDAAG
jgi:hypothetical protein